MLVNVLIYKVYLYDDSLTIIFNTQNKPYKEKIPLIEELEEKLGACSYKVRSAQPSPAKNPLYERNLLYWWICCEYKALIFLKKKSFYK